MTTVPPGGPSTINGVFYQMLWTLLKTTRLHASGCIADQQPGQVTQATLRLEPGGGGGDLQEIGETSRVVQQLKARSDEGTWSLTEMVKSVLPDLYLAVDLADRDATYEFVTEGRIGRWEEVYELFKSLSQRVCPNADVLAALDDSKVLKLGLKSQRSRKENTEDKTFWPEEIHTERRLFERIVLEVRKRKAVQEESIGTTHKKLWHLLGHFRFVEEQAMKLLQQEVDRYLLHLVEYDSEVPEKRDAMLMGLARLATSGGVDINDSARFLAGHGLASTPFSAWPVLRERSRMLLEGAIEQLGYRDDDDMRLARAKDLASSWVGGKPLLAISGNSGQGKSWLLYALARQISSGPELIILVEARGRAEDDLDEAARICWHEIKKNDMTLPLSRIAERLRRVDRDRAGHWLTLLVDGIQSVEEGRNLAKQPWATWGVRLIVSCEPEVAGEFEEAAQGRCAATVSVGDFTSEELQRYLTRCFGTDWPDIPGDVRHTLRRPLLARLYRDLAQHGRWRPTNEYELYKKYWHRLGENERIDRPLDRVGLERLARSILDGARYPWTAEQLSRAGLDNQSINALIRVGWLRRTTGNRFEVWHNRLLNWAVAAALVESFQSGDIEPDDFCSLLRNMYGNMRGYGGRYLGYVPMDACWLLANSNGDLSDLLDRALQSLEDMPWNAKQTLYCHLLPTVGSAIVPALFRRLEAVAPSADHTHTDLVVNAITVFEEKAVSSSAIQLLGSKNAPTQRAAMRILSRRPSATALDQLWELHCSGQVDPRPYLRVGEHDRSSLYKDSFSALRSCVRLQPMWLERVISRFRTPEESLQIHDLAYLLANLDDEADLWRRCKPALQRLVPKEHERCLATNIYKHNDADEIIWIVDRVHCEDDQLGPCALRALIKIAPDLAIEHLARLPVHLLHATRHWCFEELIAKRPEATGARIAEMLQSSVDPFDIALVYRGSENSITVDILNALLDRLETTLKKDFSKPSPPSYCPPYRAFLILYSISHPDLLECIRLRRAMTLEETLTEWLLHEGLHHNAWHTLAGSYGLELLYKIGGTGFIRVVNQYLQLTSQLEQRRGLKMAFRRPDETTIELLRRITTTAEIWDHHMLDRSRAVQVLIYLKQWEEAIVAMIRWNLPVEPELLRACVRQGAIDATAIAPALRDLEREEVIDTGAVLALGLGGRIDQTARIRSILHETPPGSDLAQACVISLGLLHDSSTEAVELLIAQLNVDEDDYEILIGLIQSDSELALDALIERLHAKFNISLAIDLISKPHTRQRATEMIHARLRDTPDDQLQELVIPLLSLEDEFLAPFLKTSRIRDALRERSFGEEAWGWTVGSKAIAIRGLSKFDRDAAFLAARKTLQNSNSHDREYYPYLLVEFDAERATETLLEQALVEKNPLILRSMARALQEVDLSEILSHWVISEDVERRLAACRMVAANARGSDVIAADAFEVARRSG